MDETIGKKRYNYWEDIHTLQELESLADARTCSVSELIRQATRKLLDDAPETQQPHPAQLTLF